MVGVEPEEGPVLVAVEYRVNPERSQEFVRVMHEFGRIRRRDSAARWGLDPRDRGSNPISGDLPGRIVGRTPPPARAPHDGRPGDRRSPPRVQPRRSAAEARAPDTGASRSDAASLRSPVLRLVACMLPATSNPYYVWGLSPPLRANMMGDQRSKEDVGGRERERGLPRGRG